MKNEQDPFPVYWLAMCIQQNQFRLVHSGALRSRIRFLFEDFKVKNLSIPLGFRSVLIFVVAASVSSGRIRAADANLYGIIKHQKFSQTDTGPVVFQNPSAPYAFKAAADGISADLILNFSVTLPNTTVQTGSPYTASFFNEPGYEVNTAFSTLAALDSAYPPGAYTLTFSTAHDGAKQVTETLQANAYPPPPHVSNFNAAQVVNPLADFVVTWDSFANGTANDYVALQIVDAQNNIVFSTPTIGATGALNGLAALAVVPGGTLSANQVYSARLYFLKIASVDTSSYPGSLGLTGFQTKTYFNLQTTNPPGVFPIATNSSVASYSDGIAFDGTNYLVEILVNGTNAAVQLVSSSGALIGSQIAIEGGSSFQSACGLAFGKTNYLVAWSDSTIGSGVDMFGQFISRSGAKVGPAFNLLQSQGSHGFQTLNAVASDGTNFLVVWQDGNNNSFYGQLVTPAGTLSGPEFVISSQSQNGSRAAVTFGKTNYLVVWQSNNGNVGNVNQAYGEYISQNGAAGSPFQIGQTSSVDQNFVSVAFDGTNYLAVWMWDPPGSQTESTVTNWQFYARLVSQTGTFPGNELILTTNRNQVIPSLAFDGANYLLAYGFDSNTTNSDGNLRCQFIDRSGNLVGPAFTPFARQGANLPLFALNGLLFDGARFVVAATLGTFGFTGEVFGGFIPASTTPPVLSLTGPLVGTQFPGALTGTPGINYAIQVSTNLAAGNWTGVVTNSPVNGPFNFIDSQATNASRFYRAVKQ